MNIPKVAGIKAGALLPLKVKALLELSAIARQSHIMGWRHGSALSVAPPLRSVPLSRFDATRKYPRQKNIEAYMRWFVVFASDAGVKELQFERPRRAVSASPVLEHQTSLGRWSNKGLDSKKVLPAASIGSGLPRCSPLKAETDMLSKPKIDSSINS
jgi:hypothetical protein